MAVELDVGQPILLPPGGGEVVGDSALLVDLTNGSEPVHDRLICFDVLEGELAVVVGERELRTEAGGWAQIPPGMEHSIAASGARFLEIRA